MKRLQDVLAALSDEEALAVWKALAAHVENELCRDDDEAAKVIDSGGTWTGGPCEAVVERLDAVIASVAEESL